MVYTDLFQLISLFFKLLVKTFWTSFWTSFWTLFWTLFWTSFWTSFWTKILSDAQFNPVHDQTKVSDMNRTINVFRQVFCDFFHILLIILDKNHSFYTQLLHGSHHFRFGWNFNLLLELTNQRSKIPPDSGYFCYPKYLQVCLFFADLWK